MQPERHLVEGDIHTMVGSLARIAGMDSGLAAKRKELLEELAVMIRSDAWVWGSVSPEPSGKAVSFTLLQIGGFSDEQFAKYLRIQEHPDMLRFNTPMMEALAANQTHTTWLRQHLDPEGEFQKSEVYALWKEANLAPLILSARPSSDGKLNLIALYRRFDRDLFSERDNQIAHIMLSQVGWLYDDHWAIVPSSSMHELSPRQRTICHLLIQGRPRKQIADDLELSIHTLNDYIKQIYNHFGVHSQPELVSRFVSGKSENTRQGQSQP